MPSLLLVEDNPGDARLIAEMIVDAGGGFDLQHVETVSEAHDRLALGGVDAVLLDLTLPDSEGLPTVAKVRGVAPDAAIVVLTGNADVSVAVDAVKEGAEDFLVKGRVDSELLVKSVRYAIGHHESQRAVEREREQLGRAEQIAHLGSWRFDVASDRMWWSDEAYRIFGVDRAELDAGYQDALDRVVLPQDRQCVRDLYDPIVAGATSSSSRFRIVRADGDVRSLEARARREADDGGTLVSISGFVQDVTELHEARERFERAAALDRAVASLSAVLVSEDLSMAQTAVLVLQQAKSLTASPIGFVSYVDEESSRITLYTPDPVRGLGGTLAGDDPGSWVVPMDTYAHMWGGGAGEVPFFTNDPGSDARSGARPSEHLDVSRLLEAPALAEGRFVGQIVVANAPHDYTDDDLEAVSRLATLYAAAIVRVAARAALVSSNSQLEHMVYGVAEAIGRIVEVRDPYTQGHEVRVARLGKLIAQEMGVPKADVDGIEMAGLVHDIGKLSVPAEILSKPGVLSEAETALIREHPTAGYQILKDIYFPWPVADIVLQHHERVDGSGYPHGLRGEAILLGARILAVADVVEAMASHRPYRPAKGLAAAMDEITSNPERYDDDVSAAFVRLASDGSLGL